MMKSVSSSQHLMWALLIAQLALYLLMLYDEGHRVSKDEESLAGCFSGVLESVRELAHRTSLGYYGFIELKMQTSCQRV
jgi:hypothetical protein